MTVVHILTEGFVTPNGQAFLSPILYHAGALRTIDIHCQVFPRVEPSLTYCDVLLVDSKYYREAWAKSP